MGNVVSFYSFKGGTGRSTALSNIAYELADRGASVGCMDFDLSAPGLHWIYDVGSNRLMNTRSIHDYLDPNKVNSQDLDDYVIDLSRSYRDENIDGDLLLMPGSMNAKVAAEAVGGDGRGNNSNDLWHKIRSLISDFEAHYGLDYVFLDSRSGISNQAMPLFQEASTVLTFTKWTHQHKLGTNELVEWIFDTGLEFDSVRCVASNIPRSVPESDISEWVDHELHYEVRDYSMIFESELLKEKERILTQEVPDSDAAEQYGELATALQEP